MVLHTWQLLVVGTWTYLHYMAFHWLESGFAHMAAASGRYLDCIYVTWLFIGWKVVLHTWQLLAVGTWTYLQYMAFHWLESVFAHMAAASGRYLDVFNLHGFSLAGKWFCTYGSC